MLNNVSVSISKLLILLYFRFRHGWDFPVVSQTPPHTGPICLIHFLHYSIVQPQFVHLIFIISMNILICHYTWVH